VQKGGGVGVYIRDNLLIKKIESTKQLNLECISFEIEEMNISIVICYRSPQQNKKEFIINLIEHLKQINIKNTLIIGDLNENSLDNKSKPIETKLKDLGFVNIFKDLPTTNSLTSLDCVYSNFIINKDQYRDVTGTFYSFHDALICSVNLEKKNSELNKEIDFNKNDEMEIDDSLQSSSSSMKTSVKTNKRKRNLIKTKCNKIFKKTSNLPTTNQFNHHLNEKQIHFLRNYHNIIKENCLQKETTTFTLNEQLHNLGFKIIDMPGDGNCFFRAISHQLYRHEKDHRKIRSETMKYLMLHKNEFASFVVSIDGTIEHYIENMSKSGTYVDYITVIAAAIAINKNLVIHEKNARPKLVPGCDIFDHQLHLAFHPDMPHYDSAICIDGNTGFLEYEHMLQI
jgi:hypothetical protein